MTGAITQAIEALEYIELAGPDGSWRAKEALEVLKAFRDGVPEGLDDEIIVFYKDIHDATSTSEAIVTAAKHLQDGVK